MIFLLFAYELKIKILDDINFAWFLQSFNLYIKNVKNYNFNKQYSLISVKVSMILFVHPFSTIDDIILILRIVQLTQIFYNRRHVFLLFREVLIFPFL